MYSKLYAKSLRKLLRQLGKYYTDSDKAEEELLKYPLEVLLPKLEKYLPEFTKPEIQQRVTLVLLLKEYYEVLPDYVSIITGSLGREISRAIEMWQGFPLEHQTRILNEMYAKLESTSELEVIEATIFLSRMKFQEAIPHLLSNLLNHANQNVVARTAFALSVNPSKEVIDPIITVGSQTTNESVKLQICKAIWTIRNNLFGHSLQELQQAIPFLLLYATTEQNYQLRAKALVAIRAIVIIDKLPDHCFKTKKEYSDYLSDFESMIKIYPSPEMQELQPDVITILRKDKSATVRMQAASLMKQIATEEIVDELIQIAIKESSPYASSELLCAIAKVLQPWEVMDKIRYITECRDIVLAPQHLIDAYEIIDSSEAKQAIADIRSEMSYYYPF